MIDELPV